MKELFYLVGWFHQLPEKPIPKWIVRITPLGAMFLVSNAAEWKSTFGLIQDPQLTMEELQMAIEMH